MSVKDPKTFCETQRALCQSLDLRGRILVAQEGVNATLSGRILNTQKYIEVLHKEPHCADIEFKIESCDQHLFPRLQVRTREEIVHVALPYTSSSKQAPYLSPHTLRDILEASPKEWVLLDVRDDYEHQLGHFRHARCLSMKCFREFTTQLDVLRPLKRKKVITYCTGGIRCEKASAWLLSQGFKDVYQLQGGIIAYAQQTDGAYFNGRCYVFDQRISIPINRFNSRIIATCYRCGQLTEHMTNCANMLCNKQILLCETCATVHHHNCGTCSPPFRVRSSVDT